MRALKLSLLMVIATGLLAVSAQASNILLDYLNGTRIYYSHIAVNDDWETEIAAINPTDTDTTITLTAYDNQGDKIGNSVTASLKAHGRYLRLVSETFSQADDIEYIKLESDLFGIKGYSKFYRDSGPGSNRPRIRASIVAAEPRTSGIFSKIDHEGWTGIAFVNTGSATAHITLKAYNDAGGVVATQAKTVKAGYKVVDVAEDLFAESIANAAYIKFTSDQKVVGFYLNGSVADDMLDGSTAQ